MQPGEIVYVELLPRISIEGYTGRAGDASYWNDPELSTEYWNTKARPAIILEANQHGLRVVPITLKQPVGTKVVKITNLTSEYDENTIFLPGWPFKTAYAYSFPRSILIFPLPEVHF